MTTELEVPRVHVHFTFTIVDEWPPVRGECVWATVLGDDRYLIDNIPFFAMDIALNDVVEAKSTDGGELEFVRKVRSGGHSTLRVLAEPDLQSELRGQILALGCGIEADGSGVQFAVDVPPESDLEAVLALCEGWLAAEIAGYETACLVRR